SFLPIVPDILAVRTASRKYVTYPSDPSEVELYDLLTDPNEMRNLAGRPEWAAAQADLRRQLERLLVETGAPQAPGPLPRTGSRPATSWPSRARRASARLPTRRYGRRGRRGRRTPTPPRWAGACRPSARRPRHRSSRPASPAPRAPPPSPAPPDAASQLRPRAS